MELVEFEVLFVVGLVVKFVVEDFVMAAIVISVVVVVVETVVEVVEEEVGDIAVLDLEDNPDMVVAGVVEVEFVVGYVMGNEIHLN